MRRGISTYIIILMLLGCDFKTPVFQSGRALDSTSDTNNTKSISNAPNSFLDLTSVDTIIILNDKNSSSLGLVINPESILASLKKLFAGSSIPPSIVLADLQPPRSIKDYLPKFISAYFNFGDHVIAASVSNVAGSLDAVAHSGGKNIRILAGGSELSELWLKLNQEPFKSKIIFADQDPSFVGRERIVLKHEDSYYQFVMDSRDARYIAVEKLPEYVEASNDFFELSVTTSELRKIIKNYPRFRNISFDDVYVDSRRSKISRYSSRWTDDDVKMSEYLTSVGKLLDDFHIPVFLTKGVESVVGALMPVILNGRVVLRLKDLPLMFYWEDLGSISTLQRSPISLNSLLLFKSLSNEHSVMGEVLTLDEKTSSEFIPMYPQAKNGKTRIRLFHDGFLETLNNDSGLFSMIGPSVATPTGATIATVRIKYQNGYKGIGDVLESYPSSIFAGDYRIVIPPGPFPKIMIITRLSDQIPELLTNPGLYNDLIKPAVGQ